MKAQFATTEAIVSLLLAASIVSFAYVQLSGATAAFASSTKQMQNGAAAYDLLNLFARNATANTCLGVYLLHGNSSCVQSIAGAYGAELGVAGIRVGNNASATSACGTILLLAGNVLQRVCVSVGG